MRGSIMKSKLLDGSCYCMMKTKTHEHLQWNSSKLYHYNILQKGRVHVNKNKSRV